jgi:hypothetical protein
VGIDQEAEEANNNAVLKNFSNLRCLPEHKQRSKNIAMRLFTSFSAQSHN